MFVNPNSFVSEGATWSRINKDYDFLCVNMIHRVYWYSADGIINQKKSKLKIEKNNYYNAFFQLNETPLGNIFNKRYYRHLAFNYTKALFYYRDSKNRLKGVKFCCVFLIFLSVLPVRIWYKLKTIH